MGYYLRAFCRSKGVPLTRAELIDWASANSVAIRVHPEPRAEETISGSWSQAEIGRESGQTFFLLEVTGEADRVRDEVDEFLELVNEADECSTKDRVRAHLAATQSVVAVQVIGDPDDRTLDIASAFLQLVASKCNGLIQADGEGFYEKDELILEVP